MLTIGFVCEGPTDTPVLEAVIEAILGPDFDRRYIQPEVSNLRGWSSGGDSRVEQWCKRYGHALEYMLFDIDLLIVQLDGDRCATLRAADTTELCATIKGWLAGGAEEPKLIIVIPAQASEAWLVAANLSANPALEQQRHPEDLLAKKGLLERGADGRPIKDRARYEELAIQLRDRLAEVRPVLPELQRFARKLERFKARPTPSVAETDP